MGITISGENNNDRILASDGVIDQLSGFNVVGVITATSFTGDLTGDVTGNLTGNVTGNINNSTLLLQTGGTERLRIDSSGRVLIGTTTPTSFADELVLATSGDCGITIMSGTAHNGRLYFSDSGQEGDGFVDYDHEFGNLKLGTRDITRFTIDSSGRVLLGTGTEGHANADDLTIATSGSTGITIRSGSGNAGNIAFSDGTSGDDEIRGLIQYHHNDNVMKLFTNATERLRITSDGKFGFGTASLSENTIAEFSRDVGGGGLGASITVRNTSTNSVNNVAELRLKTNHGVARFYKYNTGSTVIQSHTGGASDLLLYADGASNLRLHTNAVERLRIGSDGRIGVNDSTPSDYELDIRKRSTATDAEMRLYNNETGSSNDTIMRYQIGGTSASNYIYFGDGDDSNAGQIRYSHNNDSMIFNAGADERLRITSAGLIRMGNGAAGNTEAHVTAAIFQNTTGAATILKLGNTNTPSSANNRAIEFCDGAGGTEGSSKYTYARIKAERTGGSNAGRLMFFTKPDNSSDATEKLRITSDGKVSIGGFNPSVAGLSISNSSTNRGFEFDTGSGFDSTSCIRAYDRPTTAYKSLGLTGSDIRFGINDSERLRITSGGNLSIGNTNGAKKVHISTTGNQKILIDPNYNNNSGGSANSEADANNIVESILIRTSFGSNAASQTNKGHKWGIKFQGYNGNDFTQATAKCAGVFAVSEDEATGYNKNVGLAFHTSPYNTAHREVMRINTNGIVTKPYQYAFLVATSNHQKTANWSHITNHSIYSSQCTGVSDGTYWSNSTQRFTAPVTGVYNFYVGGWSYGNSNGTRYAYAFKHQNDNSLLFIGGGDYCSGDSPMAGWSRVIKLTAGEWVELWGYSAIAVRWGGGHRFFWGGYLLG